MGSSRLPGKVLMNLPTGRSVLAQIIYEVQKSRVDEVVVATSEGRENYDITREAVVEGAQIYVGSEEDVLERFYLAAKEYNADVIIRLTADCPLLDHKEIDRCIEYYEGYSVDLVCNSEGDICDGSDVEVFSKEALSMVYHHAHKRYDREHVTTYLRRHGQVEYLWYAKDSISLDTIEDYNAICKKLE